MKTRFLNYVMGCLAVIPTVSAAQKADQIKGNADRPNILLILCDDMGKECLGTYGSSYKTPNLDRLAEQGVQFNNGFSCPLSTPSRVQLMTGKYNYKNYSKFEFLNQDQKTFANLAKEAGYTTAIAGKWQLGQNSKLPAHFGFDKYCLWNLNYRKMGTERERYAKPLIERDGVLLDDFTENDYGPDIFSNYLMKFMEKNKDKPLFMYYSMVLVHDPFLPTPDSKIWNDSVQARHIPQNGNFSDMVSYSDKIVGKLLDKLEQLNLRKKTIVIFVGDNGTARYMSVPMKDGTLFKGGKGKTLDAGIRVPLIVDWGKVKYKKHTNDNLIDFTDFLPTFAEAMRIDIPKSWGEMDGKSFLPMIQDKKGNPRDYIFCHYNPLWNPTVNKFAGRFFRDTRYKLYSDGRLFDTKTDPEELKPIPVGQGSSEAEAFRTKFTLEHKKLPAWKNGESSVPVVILPGLELLKEATSKADNDRD